MAQKLYGNLIKPTLVRPGPAGLYPKPLIWMEAKDMEGFNAHFVYGFITEPGTLHPMEGMVVHPYDEVLVFAGYQDGNVRRIDAEISIVLGEEREIPLRDLYELDHEAFELAIELIKDWRLDRYYAARIKLFDVVLAGLPGRDKPRDDEKASSS